MPTRAHGTTGECDGCRAVTTLRPYIRATAGRYQLCRRCHPEPPGPRTEVG
jgi:hypothetical protein